MAELLPEGFELERLLAPISDDAPAGEDLREDISPKSPYYRLRDARAEARAAERAADSDIEGESAPPPQWRVVRDLAALALAERSKDLEIAAWYTEGLMRSDGLRGLLAGARLMTGLAEGFWDALYPLPDEDGIATRVAPVTGLNGEGGDGTLIQPLRKLPLFQRGDGSWVPYWQYEQSAEVSAIGDAARRAQRLAAGVVPFDTLQAEAQAAGAHLTRMRAEAEAASAAWQALIEVFDRLAGADSPPTSRVRDLLGQVVAVTVRYGAAAPADVSAEASADAALPGAAAGGLAAVAGTAVAVPAGGMTREDALRLLGDIAEYFRKTEPNSPLAYTLHEAVRRGRMSWPDLLAEIVPDETTRSGILTTLGIKPPVAE